MLAAAWTWSSSDGIQDPEEQKEAEEVGSSPISSILKIKGFDMTVQPALL